MSNSFPYFFAQTHKCLLVEDILTRECFLELFPQSQSWVTIRTAGSSHAVHHLTKEWNREFDGVSIIGWRDRDFAMSSPTDSYTVSGNVFVGVRHEFENYLLNWRAIQVCASNERWTAQALENTVKGFATGMCWRMACCREIASIHADVQYDFPHHPKACEVSNESEAVDYIGRQPWMSNVKNMVNDKLGLEQIRNEIRRFHHDYEMCLQGEEWMKSFPGKELFTCLCQNLFQDASPQKRLDFAKAICRWCYENNQVPEELKCFMDDLKRR